MSIGGIPNNFKRERKNGGKIKPKKTKFRFLIIIFGKKHKPKEDEIYTLEKVSSNIIKNIIFFMDIQYQINQIFIFF